ncbi:MAG: T9SS type A sorting domain-containing protein [Bacteroidetes bacterium]|nr:T9SS type A sorting domain-containing protein [Bacteroidota bacterium]
MTWPYQQFALVAGKFLSINGNVKDYVMAWDGEKWIDPFPDIQFWFEAYDLEVIAGKLYIVAPVTSNQIRRMHTLAHFDGTYFCIFGSGEESLLNVAGLGGSLFVSGAPNPVPPLFDIHYIAEWMGGNPTDSCIYQPVSVSSDPISSTRHSGFPNPAYQSFKIETNPAFSSFTLRIHDITGREVATYRTYRAGDPPVDVAPLSAGLYFVEVRPRIGLR